MKTIVLGLMLAMLAGTAFAVSEFADERGGGMHTGNCRRGICWIVPDPIEDPEPATTASMTFPAYNGRGKAPRAELDVSGITLQHYIFMNADSKAKVQKMAIDLARLQGASDGNIDDWTTRIRWATKKILDG